MLKYKIEDIKKKVSGLYDEQTIGQKYILADKMFKTFSIIEPNFINDSFKKTKLNELYKKAEDLVLLELKKGMRIVHDYKKREITLIFPDESRDTNEPFFEIVSFIEKLTKDNLERLVLIGFFMDQEKMTVIQVFNILSNEIKMRIYEN